jgi:hypothetical protein
MKYATSSFKGKGDLLGRSPSAGIWPTSCSDLQNRGVGYGCIAVAGLAGDRKLHVLGYHLSPRMCGIALCVCVCVCVCVCEREREREREREVALIQRASRQLPRINNS